MSLLFSVVSILEIAGSFIIFYYSGIDSNVGWSMLIVGVLFGIWSDVVKIKQELNV